jgi:hypothetical protein
VSGASGSGTQIDIPVSAARVENGGVLAYDVQMTRTCPTTWRCARTRADSLSVLERDRDSRGRRFGDDSIALAQHAAVGEETTGIDGLGLGTAAARAAGRASMGRDRLGLHERAVGRHDSSTSTTTGSAAAMSSLDFDGAGEFLASSAAYPIGASSEFSLSVWALADPQATGSRTLVSVRGGGGATQNRVELSSDTTDLALSVTNDAGQLVYSAVYAAVLVPGEWQHLALTFDASVDSAPLPDRRHDPRALERQPDRQPGRVQRQRRPRVRRRRRQRDRHLARRDRPRRVLRRCPR